MKFTIKKINIFVVFRLVIAVIFIASGTEKLLSPVENFVYAIQSYDLIHDPDLQESIALLFPWLELFAGVFLLLGLWTKAALIGTGAMACGFIIFVGQGITRKLPLVDCGCFGDLAHFPISVTFAIDWAILVCSILLYIKADQTKKMSLDKNLD